MLNFRKIQAETTRLVKAGHEAAFQGFAAIVAEAYALHTKDKDPAKVKSDMQKRMWDMRVDSPTISRYVKAALAFNRMAAKHPDHASLKAIAAAADEPAYHAAVRAAFTDAKADKVYTAIAWAMKGDFLPLSQATKESLRGTKPSDAPAAKDAPKPEIGKPAGHAEPNGDAPPPPAEKSAAEKVADALAVGLKAIRDCQNDDLALGSLTIALNKALAYRAKIKAAAEKAKPTPAPTPTPTPTPATQEAPAQIAA